MTANYPGANRSLQFYFGRFGGSKMTPNVVVLHTTEGGSWPAYSSGAVAPNLTILANKRTQKLEIRQHYPLDRSSRALRNKLGGVETNTANVIQIELIGSCDRKDGYGAIYWPDAPEWCYRELGKVLATLHDLFPAIPLSATPVWLPYPASFGATAARMSFTQWRTFVGVCGHQHVPENVHGDPGNLPIAKILGYAPAKPKPVVKGPVVKKPQPQPKPVPDAAILAATTVTTPSDHKAVGARIKTGPAQFVAVTANIRATPPMRAVNVQRCVDRALGHGVTIAGFNEMGGRNLAALLAKHPGWVALQGKRGDQARAPIAYDTNVWELVRWEVRRLSTRTVTTRLGTIPVPSGNRDATIAVLGHKATGTEVAFISYHAIAHMNIGSRFGWTGKGPKVLLTLRRKIPNPAIAVFKQGMAVLEETINELRADGCYVVPMGDWNYDAFADLRDKTPERFGPRATMHRAGVTTIYSAKKLTHGTAGKRGIDYLGVAPPKSVTGEHSDHR